MPIEETNTVHADGMKYMYKMATLCNTSLCIVRVVLKRNSSNDKVLSWKSTDMDRIKFRKLYLTSKLPTEIALQTRQYSGSRGTVDNAISIIIVWLKVRTIWD